MAVKNETKWDPMVVQTILLSEIEIDRNWNGRVSLPVESETDGTEGFKNLVTLIGRDGQKTPVVVRPNPRHGKEKTAKQFQLASGFGRCEAIAAIAVGGDDITNLLGEGPEGLSKAAIALKKTDKPTIKAFVRVMNDLEMREENAGENAQRSQLSTADKAFIAADLKRLNPHMTIQRVADVLNMNQSYAGELLRTIEKLRKVMLPIGWRSKDSPAMAVLDAWRRVPEPPGQGKMLDIAEADVSDSEKAALFLKAAKLTKTVEAPKPARGPDQWVVNAKQRIEEMAEVFALLAKGEVITIEGTVFTPESVPSILAPMYPTGLPEVKARKGVTIEQAQVKRGEHLSMLAAAGEDALATAIKGKKVGAGKGKGKSTNGSSVNA